MGGDEGYELIKGLLCSRGFTLYKDIWSDQPPLFSLAIDCGFRTFGPSLTVARFIAAAFGLTLFLAFFYSVSHRSGPLSALLGCFFLVSSPAILLLSVSVMQEVPAFAVAMISAALVLWWRNGHHWVWLLLSGVFMGLALQVKYTAALMVPAIIVEIILQLQAPLFPIREVRAAASRVLLWTSAVVLTFGLVATLSGAQSLSTSWKAHFGAHPQLTMDHTLKSPADFPLQVSLLWNHVECVGAAALGIILAFPKHRVRKLAFPMILLVTALAIHVIHRPWWNYYYLHLAIPLAWLAGVAVQELVLISSGLFSKSRFSLNSPATWKGIAISVITGFVVVRSELRLEASVNDIQGRVSADANPFVQKMKEFGGRTHWVYAERQILAFHAGLALPPELAVVSLKRFWSGQITRPEIVEICKRYQTEQILLNAANIGEEWREFLDGYDIALKDQDFVLYVAKRINSPALNHTR